MKKKIILFLCLVIALTFFACGKLNEKNKETSVEETGETVGEEIISEEEIDPESVGYCGNMVTRIHIDGKEYSFMYSYSVSLTHMLRFLDYKTEKAEVQYVVDLVVDTEFGNGYGVNLSEGFIVCDKGRAELTKEQVAEINEIVEWVTSEKEIIVYPGGSVDEPVEKSIEE